MAYCLTKPGQALV